MPEQEKLERGARLKRLRDALKWTQDDVASRAGKPEFVRESVAKVETGINNATSVEVQQCLARAFSVDVELMANYLAGRITMEAVLIFRQSPVDSGRSISTPDRPESDAFVRDPVVEHVRQLRDLAPTVVARKTPAVAPSERSITADDLSPNKQEAMRRLWTEIDPGTVPPAHYEHLHRGLVAIQFSSGKDADVDWLLGQARRLLQEAQRGETGEGPAAARPDPNEPSPERKAQLAAKTHKGKR